MSLDPNTLKEGDRVLLNGKLVVEFRHRITKKFGPCYAFLDEHAYELQISEGDSAWDRSELVNEPLLREMQSQIDALDRLSLN
jgi:hypothetical protein